MKSEKTSNGFFVMMVDSSIQPGFLSNPHLVRLMTPRQPDRDLRKLSDVAVLSYPIRYGRRDVSKGHESTSYDLLDKRRGLLYTEELSGIHSGLFELPACTIAYGRIRPYLANIAVVPATRYGTMLTKSEWIIVNQRQGFNHLLCEILRGPFCISQVYATSGQTRPRLSLEALAELVVPWPFSTEEAAHLNKELAVAAQEQVEIHLRLQEIKDRLYRKVGLPQARMPNSRVPT